MWILLAQRVRDQGRGREAERRLWRCEGVWLLRYCLWGLALRG